MELLKYLVTGEGHLLSKEEKDMATASLSFVRGKLIKRLPEGERVVPPPAERYHVVEQAHILLAHAGQDKLLAYLAERFWWPGLGRDVRQLCESCLECSL